MNALRGHYESNASLRLGVVRQAILAVGRPAEDRPWRGTIYLVDDDDTVRASLRVLLEAAGYTVDDFASAVDFLRFARPDDRCCILTDVQMPAMNGLELLDRVRNRGVIVPAIVMTGASDSDIEDVVAARGATLLKKPFNRHELVALIEQLLAAGHSEDA